MTRWRSLMALATVALVSSSAIALAQSGGMSSIGPTSGPTNEGLSRAPIIVGRSATHTPPAGAKTTNAPQSRAAAIRGGATAATSR